MKCGVPVIGKIPSNKPAWIGENGIWVNQENDIADMLSEYVISWVDDKEIYDEFKTKVQETAAMYNKESFNANVDSIFNTIYNGRLELFTNTINNLKENAE